MAWLNKLELPAIERFVLDSELQQLKAVEQELASLDEQLIKIAGENPQVRLLMTLPGVSYTLWQSGSWQRSGTFVDFVMVIMLLRIWGSFLSPGNLVTTAITAESRKPEVVRPGGY